MATSTGVDPKPADDVTLAWASANSSALQEAIAGKRQQTEAGNSCLVLLIGLILGLIVVLAAGIYLVTSMTKEAHSDVTGLEGSTTLDPFYYYYYYYGYNYYGQGSTSTSTSTAF